MKGSVLRAQQRAKRDAARQRVREAAIEVFQAMGFEGTTMKTLAERAGMSVGMIYQLYEGKSDVLLDVIATHNADQWEVMTALAGHASGFEGLIQLLAVRYGFDVRLPQLAGIAIAQSWLWDLPQEARYRADVERLRSIIAIVLRRGFPNAPPAEIEAAAQGVHDIYMRGLRAAVFDAATAEECATRLRPVLAVLLRGLAATPPG